VSEALRRFFSSEIFLPQGHCYLWRPGLVLMEVASNAIIGLALLVTAALLLRRVLRRRGSPPPGRRLYVGVGLAAAACGLTHLGGLWMIWHPAYWVDAAVRAVAAAACVAAALAVATESGSG
jgi:hypothetical protein